jgi:hypothetical protein
MNKTEIKRTIKLLIKKYHPDLCKNDKTEINNEITKKLTGILNDLKIHSKNNPKNIPAAAKQAENGLIHLEQQDYLYYKLGIKYYKNIHPNFIYKRKSQTSFTLKSYNELLAALKNIILSIFLSKLYFTKVILEYPNSIWRNDAIAKVKLILKLTKSYENINPNERKVVDSRQFVNEMGIKRI